MHPALQFLHANKQASGGVSTQGAAAAYGAATRSLMSGAGKSSGKIRHPENTKQVITPELKLEANESGHPVSNSPETITEAIKSRLSRGEASLSKTASAVRDRCLLARIRRTK